MLILFSQINTFKTSINIHYAMMKVSVSNTLCLMYNVKEAENRQPWVVNGHNAHTPDSREACQAIAFYDNFTPEKSRPIKIEPLSIT